MGWSEVRWDENTWRDKRKEEKKQELRTGGEWREEKWRDETRSEWRWGKKTRQQSSDALSVYAAAAPVNALQQLNVTSSSNSYCPKHILTIEHWTERTFSDSPCFSLLCCCVPSTQQHSLGVQHPESFKDTVASLSLRPGNKIGLDNKEKDWIEQSKMGTGWDRKGWSRMGWDGMR